MRSLRWVSGLVLLGGVGACTSPNTLPAAAITNQIDTVVVYALSGTAPYQPSGYSMTDRRVVRLDQSTNTDFAYDVTPSGQHILLPATLIGQAGTNVVPGLKASAAPFDSLKLAETEGYLTLDTVKVELGNVLFARSRVPGTCYYGLPVYGKVEVISFDDSARTMRFRVLVDLNCGYKSLETGLPTR